eukprot:5882986-Amphidinium_carterae.1
MTATLTSAFHRTLSVVVTCWQSFCVGSTETKGATAAAVPPWEDLLHRLGPRVLPLLLQHPDFIPETERRSTEMDSETRGLILQINCHGASPDEERLLNLLGHRCPQKIRNVFREGSMDLYPAVAMFNHSSQPSCHILPVAREGGQVMVLVQAGRSIRKGEELTILYAADADILTRRWGIKE